VRKRYERILEQEVSFLFAYERDAPDLLHIFARHTTTPEDVFEVWFDAANKDIRNEERRRFETSNDTHTVYWKFSDLEPEVVFVITCFRRSQ
jgi:hypothetical protein